MIILSALLPSYGEDICFVSWLIGKIDRKRERQRRSYCNFEVLEGITHFNEVPVWMCVWESIF